MNFKDFLKKMEETMDADDKNGFWELCERYPELASAFISLDEKYGKMKAKAKKSTDNPEEGFMAFLHMVCEQAEKKGKDT